jgi:lipopolysaccharide export system permease protein
MKTMQLMVVRAFLPVLLLSEFFFLLIVILVDLFSNLWRYLQNDAGLYGILMASAYYIPKAALFGLPPALLFAVAFTLGNYQSRNELIAVFASGVSLVRFTFPIIFISLLLSFGSYFFQEHLVIPTWAEKRTYSDTLIGRSNADNNSNVVILSGGGRFLYKADYYNDKNSSLTGITVLERDGDGKFLLRIESEWAEFSEHYWKFHRARSFFLNTEGSLVEEYHPVFDDPRFSESPDSFRRQIGSVDELKTEEARIWIDSLQTTGSDRYTEALTGYYERFAFSLTPLIVTLLSVSISGYFRKNIMLMSLLSSLVISVVYYVSEMVLVLFARQGLLRPITGAWASAVIFLIISLFLLKKAKS